MCILSVYTCTLLKVVGWFESSVSDGIPKKVWMVCELYPSFFLDFLNFFNFAKPLNDHVFAGERGLPVLDAGARTAQLQHPDPHDPTLSPSSPHLCARASHETSRLRADAKLQGDPPGESDMN